MSRELRTAVLAVPLRVSLAWRRIVIILCLCLGMAGLQARPEDARSDSRSIEDRRALADGLYSRGMFGMAHAEYAALLRDVPDIAGRDVLLFRIGESLRNTDRAIEAEHAYHTLLSEFPDSLYRPQAGFRRAALFMDMGHPDAALLSFDRLLGEDPPPEWREAARFHRAESLAALQRNPDAQAAFEKVIQTFPDGNYAQVATLKLAALLGAQEGAPRERAIDLLRQLSEGPFAPRHGAEALFQKGLLQNAAGQPDAAALTFLALVQRYPDSPRARDAVRPAAWTCFRAERYADALRFADMALAPPPEDIEAHRDWLFLKANSLRRLLQPARAIETYAELLRLGAGGELEATVRYEKAITHFQQSEYEATLREAEQVREAPEEILRELTWLQAEAAAAMGDVPRAAQFYRLLVERYPESERVPDALYRLGFQLQGQEAWGEASRFYRRLAERFPDHALSARALLASGICLSRDGRDDEALRDWSLLLERFEDPALGVEALYHMAMAQIRRERQTEALVSIDALLRRAPDSAYGPEALFWRGVILRRIGEFAEAEAALRQALKGGGLRKPLEREATYDLALVLLELEREEEAAERFQSLLDAPVRKRFSAQRLIWLAEYQWHQDRFEAAIAASKVLLETYAEDDRWRQIGETLAGRALQSLDRSDEAAESFARALALAAGTPFEAEAALRLGELRLAAGKTAESIRCFEIAAARSDPPEALGLRVAAYRGLARASERQNDVEAAIRYNLSIGLLFDDPVLVPEALADAARLLLAQDRQEEALRSARELVERFPDSAVAAVWAEHLAESTENAETVGVGEVP